MSEITCNEKTDYKNLNVEKLNPTEIDEKTLSFPIGWVKLTEKKVKFHEKKSDNNQTNTDQNDSETKIREEYKWHFPEYLEYDCCYFVLPDQIVKCPNCMKVKEMMSFSSYSDDVFIICSCHKSLTPMHTPENFEDLGSKINNNSNIDDLYSKLMPKSCYYSDVRNFIDNEGETNYEQQRLSNFKGDDNFTQQKVREMSELRLDDGHMSSYSPNFRGCFKILRLRDSNIPEHVYKSIVRSLKKGFDVDEDCYDQTKDDIDSYKFRHCKKDDSDQDDNNDHDNNDQDYGDTLIAKMGIIQIEEFSYYNTLVNFIIKNMKMHFGIEYTDGGRPWDEMDFLPIILPVLREKVARYYPNQLEMYDKLLKCVEPYWHFSASSNRHGYTKFLFDVAKFFGYKPYTPDSGHQLDDSSYMPLYNGICRCCNQRVYGLMGAD